MTITVKKPAVSLNHLMRQLGYKPEQYTDKGELSAVRPLGGSYPRFHIYALEQSDQLRINLHLDQKRPSYGEYTAHSGEYDSPEVEQEAERIKQALE